MTQKKSPTPDIRRRIEALRWAAEAAAALADEAWIRGEVADRHMLRKRVAIFRAMAAELQAELEAMEGKTYVG